jgi:hypothetical protein
VQRLALALRGDLDLESGRVTRHRCHNLGCFRPDHLEIGTMGDNVRDMITAGRHDEGNLTMQDALEIRRRYAAGGKSYRELALRYRVSLGMISHIIRGRWWRGPDKVA